MSSSPRDTVSALAGKMMHPVNRPVHREDGVVIRGYGIMQPRVTPSLTTGADASVFQRVFSANRGLDPYVFTVSDLYQDLFDVGSFTGKGIYDVDAFERAGAGRMPENAVLSHDLLEGSLARAALVTDVEVVEDFPLRYATEASRQHRWTRGDWQLLGWIFGRRGVDESDRATRAVWNDQLARAGAAVLNAHQAGEALEHIDGVDVGLRDAGDPVEQAKIYDAAGADELTFLDVTASSSGRSTMIDVVKRTADQVFIPLTVGGGVLALPPELETHGPDVRGDGEDGQVGACHGGSFAVGERN